MAISSVCERFDFMELVEEQPTRVNHHEMANIANYSAMTADDVSAHSSVVVLVGVRPEDDGL